MKAEVGTLLARAEAADQADVPDGMSIPEELERREAQLTKLAEARARIEARAREQHEREQAGLEAREAKAKVSGKKAGGKPPQPPTTGPGSRDQINLTDAATRIMKVARSGFEQCYNAQAVVTAGGMLVVAMDVVPAANDKQQVAPMVVEAAGAARDAWQARDCAGRQRLFQCRQCGYLPGSRDRADDCHRARAASPGADRAVRASDAVMPVEAMAHRPNRRRARRSMRSTSSFRSRCSDHQIRAGLPAVPSTGRVGCPRPMEPGDMRGT